MSKPLFLRLLVKSRYKWDCEEGLYLPGDAKRGKGGDHAAENTVFVADTFFCKTCNMVACFVPADDFVKIFL